MNKQLIIGITEIIASASFGFIAFVMGEAIPVDVARNKLHREIPESWTGVIERHGVVSQSLFPPSSLHPIMYVFLLFITAVLLLHGQWLLNKVRLTSR